MGTNPDVMIRNERRFLIGVAAVMSIAAAIFVLRPPEIRPRARSANISVTRSTRRVVASKRALPGEQRL